MKILAMLLVLFGFTQCGSTKFDANPPFKIESASFTDWVGGQPGVRGTRVEISLDKKENVTFNSLYFKNKSTKVERREVDGKIKLTAHYTTSKPNNDIVLDVDSKKELQNKVPVVEKIPFELKDNEAVLSYTSSGNIKYVKIENVKQQKSDFFPKARQ